MSAPHWPSYPARRRGLGLNISALTAAISDVQPAGTTQSNGGVFNLNNPAQPIVGQASAQFQSLVSAAQPAAALAQGLQQQVNSAVGSTAQVWQGYANQIQSVENYPGASEAAAGMITAANGGTPSDAEIQGGFTVAATAGAVALGATATAAAAAIAPIAALVYGGGMLLGQLVQNLLGIGNPPQPCQGHDNLNGPSDPNWWHYARVYGPELPSMTTFAAGPSMSPAGWMQYSRGAFENWALPTIIRAEELWLNCKAVPPDNTATSFLQGLVGAWNAQFPSAPKRTIAVAGAGKAAADAQIAALLNSSFPTATRPPLYWQINAWQGDPVQVLLGQVSNEQGLNIAIQVADPPKSTAASKSASTSSAGSTLQTVAVGTAVVGGAALIGTGVYAYVKGQAVSTVLERAFTSLKGWFVK